MVSLDEEIQKDKQKQRSQRTGQKQSRPNQRRVQKFGRGPSDKHRGIHKDDRKGGIRKFNREERRGNKFNRPERSEDRPKSKVLQEKRGKSRISKAPRKVSTEKTEEIQEKGRTLKVMGLHPDFTNQDLYKLFSTEGALQKCLIQQDNFGRSLTTAIVKYHNASSATNAIANLNQHKVMNSILTVEPYKNKRR